MLDATIDVSKRIFLPASSIQLQHLRLIVSSHPTVSGVTALSAIFQISQLQPFKRIRRLEFVTELPKTISGKIRRAQLRRVEYEGSAADVARGVEFHEKDVLS